MRKTQLLLLSVLCLLASGGFAQVFTSVDINTGADNSTPFYYTEYNGKLYFSAIGAAQGRELWVTDGTQAGTTLVSELRPGPNGSAPQNFVVANNLLFFTATDSIHGRELWVTNGTTTTMVADIAAGTDGSGINTLTAMNNKLYFAANDGISGAELWVSDGTTAGTSLLKNINAGIASSAPAGFESELEDGAITYRFNVINNRLYFRANDGVHGIEMWTSDGTSAGTTLFKDILVGPGSSYSYIFTPLNGNILFGANDSIHGSELWISDGTPGGTSLLKDINPGINGSSPGSSSGFVAMGGKFYFGARTEAGGSELWQTDGTTAGTTMVKDILAGPGSSYAGYYGFGIYNNKLFFAADDSINGAQLWTSDGTSAGTTLLKVISDVIPNSGLPLRFLPYHGQLIFTANANTASGRQLWTTDGTSTGTHIISPAVAPNANPLIYSGSFRNYTVYNDKFILEANFNSIGDELWVYSTPATSITEASDLSGIAAYPNPFDASISLTGLNGDERYTVEVTDVAGRVCHQQEIAHASATFAISIPDLATGVYLVQLTGQTGSHTFRMVKN